MHAGQLAFTRPSAAFPPPRGEDHGEAVLVTPRHSDALDDRTLAGHAVFGRRESTHVLARPGGGCLRYKSQRPTAAFADGALPRGPRCGDLVTRCWDGAMFEIVATYREGGAVCCELVELGANRH